MVGWAVRYAMSTFSRAAATAGGTPRSLVFPLETHRPPRTRRRTVAPSRGRQRLELGERVGDVIPVRRVRVGVAGAGNVLSVLDYLAVRFTVVKTVLGHTLSSSGIST
jgi:hypothetical protein